MAERDKENVLVMALFMVTWDNVLTCANELGMSKEQVTDDLIELVKEKVSQGLADWREVVRDIVKEALKGEATSCPLGLVCSPSCAWQEVGGCMLPRGIN